MPRRQQITFNDLIEVIAKFPWWVGLSMAFGSYIVPHVVAEVTQVGTPTDLQQFGFAAGKQMVNTLATIFQYVLPVPFLIGTLLSILRRRKRAAVYAKGTSSHQHLDEMSWTDFELFVAEFFRHRGFSVKEVGGGGADGGVDLIVSSGKDRYVVQCKKWRARQVGVATVRELYGIMTASGAVGGFVVTSGEFTKEAQRFAEGREIELVPAQSLLAKAGRYPATEPFKSEPDSGDGSPACPQCGALMIIRTARKGAQAGDNFWGCPTFPKCRGTRPLQ